MSQRARWSPVAALVAIWIAACGPTTGGSDDDGGADTGGDAGARGPIELVILHTNDEHGWLEPHGEEPVGGAAAVMGYWRELEGVGEGAHLILSSGDNWTGPSISTCLDGESMVDVMNELGYRASVLGNHEVDFGRQALLDRVGEASFPYLGANVYDRATGEPWEALEPYVIEEVGGVRVAIIGLAPPDMEELVFPEHVADLEFHDAAETLEALVPVVRAQGAEVVIVAAHIAATRLLALPAVAGVDLYLGGHRHSVVTGALGEALVVESGSGWKGYSRVVLTLDAASREVVAREAEWIPVSAGADAPAAPDATITALVAEWAARASICEGDEIGYTVSGVERRSWMQANWIVDAWLASSQVTPSDLALTNTGGFFAGVEAGPITEGDLLSALPFENSIVQVHVTGADLRDQIAGGLAYCGSICSVAAAGIYYESTGASVDVVFADGTPVDDDATYSVLINDYMYVGNVGFDFTALDPAPYETSVNYRAPAIELARALATTELEPIELFLDPGPRDRLANAERIGYTGTGLRQGSWAVSNWIADAWLAARPEAEIALLPSSASRAHLPPGDLRAGNIVALLPHEDLLVEMDATGAEVLAQIELLLSPELCVDQGCHAAVAGLTYDATGDVVVLYTPEGAPLDPGATYRVVTADFFYGLLEPDQDPPALPTGISCRDSVIDWTRALATHEGDPLEAHLDATPRGTH